MKISQLAQVTGASIRSIRYYEKKGLIRVSRLANNYREFDDSIVETIKTIQLYIGLGLTTDQIKDILNCEHPEIQEIDKKGVYCEELLQAYETKLQEIIKQQQALAGAQLSLEKQIEFMKENRDKWE